MPGESTKGLWASLIDGVVKALERILAPALAYFAGRASVKAEETKEALEDAEDQLAKERQVNALRNDSAERDRVRERFKDPGTGGQT